MLPNSLDQPGVLWWTNFGVCLKIILINVIFAIFNPRLSTDDVYSCAPCLFTCKLVWIKLQCVVQCIAIYQSIF